MQTQTQTKQQEPEIIETRSAGAMVATGVTTLDVRDASNEGVKLMRERVENQKQMLKIAISLTSPSQWTVFSGKNGESVYPTGGAADTLLRRAFGLTWANKSVTIERTDDGEIEAVFRGTLMRGDVVVEDFEGRRRMGGYCNTEADMRKGAFENAKSVAVRDLLGLRFRTPAELREMGLDVGKLQRRAEFQDHGADESGVAVVPFGKKKGTPVTELDDRSLAWFIEAAQKNIADPDKAKWKAKEQRWLAALEAEKAARLGGGKPEATDGEPADAKAAADDGMPSWDQREPGAEG
jgi:hypothetical protein